MKRHQDLSIRKPEKLTTTRTRMLNPVVVTNYFNDLDALLYKLDLKDKPDQIWNCGETGKNFEHRPVKVIAAKGEKSVVGRTSASSSNITIMACVNAAGRTMPPLFVVKGKTSKSVHGFSTSAAPVGTKWFMQKNGWMTDSIGERWFEEVFLAQCGDQRPQLLVLDGHSSHESLAILELAIQHDIHILCLPPHTTHALQPLDRSVFGPLNKAFNNVCSEFLAENALHSVNKWSFPGLLSSSWDIAFTKSNIQSGFRACGIYPFNPRAVDQGMLLPSKPSNSALVPSTENESPLTPVASAPTSNDDVAIAAAGLALLSSSVIPTGDTSSSSSSSSLVADVPPSPSIAALPIEQCTATPGVFTSTASSPPVIEDPELLLQLIQSGKIDIFTPDQDGVVELENISNDVWDYTIRDMFLPTKASSDKITSSSRCAKKNTSHRLLTSTDVLKEKQESIEKKETAELKKKERQEKLKARCTKVQNV